MSKKSGVLTTAVSLITVLLLLPGCAANRLNMEEFQQAKTEVIQGDYNEVFTTTVATLREKGFHVNTIDRMQGLVSATFRFAPNRELDGAFFEGYRQRFALAMRADAVVKPVDENSTFVDITFTEELPPSASTYTLRPEDLTYRQVRTGQQYEVFFSHVKNMLENNGP
ncbi:MAG: hypothetical protein ACNA8K_05605 [Cyclonatronaceae bacterium]